MPKEVRVSVTGAAGQIGYALLFRIASGQMFGPDTKVHLNLIELEAALPALKGVIMELDDCAFPLLGKVTANSDPYKGFEGADVALLVGSVPRKAGMERSDLLNINGKIFIDQGKALDASAKETCKVLVVGNPCNTNAWIAKETVKKLSPKNFFAMTMLDENRARAALASKSGMTVNDVSHLAIWGNHSPTMFSDFYHATLGGKAVTEVIEKDWLENHFLGFVGKRGAEIIAARGASSAASAANAVVDTVRNLVTKTKAGECFSVAVSSDGSYGIPEGLMFSYPITSDGSSWYIEQGLEHNGFAQEKIKNTLNELIQERDAVAALLK